MVEMADLRTRLVQGAFRVMQTPQFVRLLQDKRVLAFLIDGMSFRARTRALLRESGVRLARILGLATLEDLRVLERDLRERALGISPSGYGPSEPSPLVVDPWAGGDEGDEYHRDAGPPPR